MESTPRTAHDERLDSVYIEPGQLRLIGFDRREGSRFEDDVDSHASEIADFDGVTQIEERPAAEISFNELVWSERADDAAVTQWFRERFDATPTRIEPVFVPIWQLTFRRLGKGGLRVMHHRCNSWYASR